MRAALWLTGLFALAVAGAWLADHNEGTVALFLHPYRIDVSLNLFVLVLVVLLAVLLLAQKALAALLSLPREARRWRLLQKERAAHAALLDAYAQFMAGRYLRARKSAEQVLLEPGNQPRERLVKLCTLHLGYATSESDRVALQSFAHYLYNSDLLSRQSTWYHWIAGHYADLLAALRPDLDENTQQGRALAILTMSIGAWITVGRSRPKWPNVPDKALKAELLAAIEHLIDK